jgi:hypothetical protein
MVWRRTKPLNGEKTHPLKPGSLKVLYELHRSGPIAMLEVNHGVVDRLDREALIDRVQRPSPYKKDKGADVAHIQITDAGRAALIAAGWEHGEPRSR